MLVSELLEDKDIPDYIKSVLPVECKGIEYKGEILRRCGKPLHTDILLSKIYCNDIKCPRRISELVYRLCTSYEMPFITKLQCDSFVSIFEIGNVTDVFMYETSDGNFSKFTDDVDSRRIESILQEHTDMTLVDYVSMFYIEGVRGYESRLLKGYDTLEEFYKSVESGGLEFIQEQLYGSKQHEGYKEYLAQVLKSKDYTELQAVFGSKYEEITQKIISDSSEKSEIESTPMIALKSIGVFKSLMRHKEELFEGVKNVCIE